MAEIPGADDQDQLDQQDPVLENVGGSTVYRRLPDGTWSAHREDAVAPAGLPAGPANLKGSAASAAQPGVDPADGLGGDPAAAASLDAATVAERVSSGQVAALAEAHLAAEVAAVMAGSNAAPAAPTGSSDAAGGPVRQAAGNLGTPPNVAGASGAPIRVVAPQSSPPPTAARVPPAAATPAVAAVGKAKMSKAGPYTPTVAAPRRRSRWRGLSLKKLVFGAVLAYVAWLIFLIAYGTFSLDKVPAAAPSANADTPGTVWLMVGSDSREELTAQERKELTTGGDFGKRTDTIMLLHMSGLGAPTLVSIPRDSWVTIPEYRTSNGQVIAAHQAKVNAAYSQGGAPLLNQTLQDATGLHIDHYAEVGFGGIVNLTNAVGGIDVCVDKDINDVKSGLKLKAGCHTLDGKQALAYVRMRYSDPKGDLGRIERQQEFVSKVMGEVLSWKTIVFPWRQWQIVNAAVDAVEVDEQANLFNVARLGLGLGQVAAGVGTVTTVPTSDTDHWVGGQWVLRWDEAAAERLWQSMGAP